VLADTPRAYDVSNSYVAVAFYIPTISSPNIMDAYLLGCPTPNYHKGDSISYRLHGSGISETSRLKKDCGTRETE